MAKNKKPEKKYVRRPSLVLTQEAQVELMLPVQMSLQLLPRGLFKEDHANNLVFFLNTAQSMGVVLKKREMIKVGVQAAEVVLAMKTRVDAGEDWNVTDEERETLIVALTHLDTWMRQRTRDQWVAALQRTNEIMRRAAARGVGHVEPIEN